VAASRTRLSQRVTDDRERLIETLPMSKFRERREQRDRARSERVFGGRSLGRRRGKASQRARHSQIPNVSPKERAITAERQGDGHSEDRLGVE
jgi:hypothetical protein